MKVVKGVPSSCDYQDSQVFTDHSFSLQELWLPIFSSFFIFKKEDERKDCFSNTLCLYFYSLLTQSGVFLLHSLLQTHVPNGIITQFLHFVSSYKPPKPHHGGFYSAARLLIKFINTSPAPIKKPEHCSAGQF